MVHEAVGVVVAVMVVDTAVEVVVVCGVLLTVGVLLASVVDGLLLLIVVWLPVIWF